MFRAGVAGTRPTLYVNVPVTVIQAVVESHGGMVSGHLPPLITGVTSSIAATASAVTATAPPPEVDENGTKWAAACQSPSSSEVDENGVKWVAVCQPPSTDSESETGSVDDEMTRSPSSAVHLGATPPPPPLTGVAMSPIERIQEDF